MSLNMVFCPLKNMGLLKNIKIRPNMGLIPVLLFMF